MKIVALPHNADALFSGSMHIPDRKFTIGRSESNDWILTDAKRLISKRHCYIEPFKGGHRIVDESTNGTSVNGKPVDRNTGQVLRQGDEIELGQYRFRVEQGSGGRVASFGDDAADNDSKPRITSILHDIAPRGVGAESPVQGEKHDIFSTGSTAQGASAIAGFTKDLGWDAPPGEKVDIVKSPHDLPRANRDLVDKFEQAPVDRLIINLPKATVPEEAPGTPSAAKPLIPDDWFEDSTPGSLERPAAKSVPQPVRRAALDTGGLVIIPVENADIDQPVSDPSVAQIYESVAAVRQEVTLAPDDQQAAAQSRQTAELVASFCAGAGISESDLAQADLVRLFYNLGRIQAISATELHNSHVAKRASLASLEAGGDTLAQTPWIFSVGGENKDQVVSAVIAFLAEAEPRDIEMVRSDFSDIGAFNGQIIRATLAFVDRVQQAMSVVELERHVSGTSKALSSLRKAALWDALIQHSGLYETGSKPDLMAILRAEVREGKPSKA